MTNLSASDFVVRVDGKERRVINAQWVALAQDLKAPRVAAVPEGFSTNENRAGGRLIVIAVDRPNLRAEATRTMMKPINAFLDKLSPLDRVAAVGFGVGSPATQFTADRERIKQALSRMVGEKRADFLHSFHSISTSEALAIARGDLAVAQIVKDRECGVARMSALALAACRAQVEGDATQMAEESLRTGSDTIRGMLDLFAGLRAIDGPKTVILISEGFMAGDQMGFINEFGALAAASRSSLYALQVGDQGFDLADVQRATVSSADRIDLNGGLEMLTQAARGALFTAVGTGTSVFDRIESELSGYYLLGLESDPRDRDGKPHAIRINVSASGAVVRARQRTFDASIDTAARSPWQAVAAGLSSPLLLSGLPLRVATFALQGPERGKVQLLIHADIGIDYSTSKLVSVGFFILDASGRAVETHMTDSHLAPVMNGVPAGLQFAAGASLPPGEYTLKLAAAEGDRVGSVEHPIHARLVDEGNVTLSELIAGGPANASERLAPTVGYAINFGVLHGYVEAYGPQVEAVTVKYEIVADGKAAPLMVSDVPGRLAGDDRMIFTLAMPVANLPPGKYVLRAAVSAAAKPVKTLTRTFEIASPPVLLTPADDARSAPATDAQLFLPIDEQALVRPFHLADAVSADALKPFRERVAASVRTDFEAGVTSLAGGDYSKAEANLKRAIQPDVDSTSAMVYLAATFAAAGHDSEAAAAWQTALVDSPALPEIYDWLSQALLRTRRLAEARPILEEAIAKWPSDARFTRPLAMLYALFGRGREALRTLERYLSTSQKDRDAYGLGVEWIYQAHAAGTFVHTRDEDVELAHLYADAYEKAKGPQLALVQQWLDFLDNEKR